MPVYRVEVSRKRGSPYLLSQGILGELREDLQFSNIDSLRAANLFEINANLDDTALRALCENLFADPITEEFSVNEHLFSEFDFCLEIAFLRGITDNVGLTAKRGIEDFLGKKLG